MLKTPVFNNAKPTAITAGFLLPKFQLSEMQTYPKTPQVKL